jgi:K+-sensing histidine kinase KdpD
VTGVSTRNQAISDHTKKRETQRHKRELATIKRITLSLANTLERDKLLPLIMEEITELMGAERSTLYLYDAESDELWSKVLLGEGLKEIRLKSGVGLAGWVAAERKTLNIPDAYADERFNPAFDKKSGFVTRSILCMPVFDPEFIESGNIIGVIQILNKRQGVFDKEDESLLEVIANQVAIALKNSELYTRLQVRAADLDLLYKLERMFSIAHSIEDVFSRVIALVAKQLSAEAGSILMQNEQQDTLYFTASYGEKSAEIARLSLPATRGIAGWVVQNGTSMIVNSPADDNRYYSEIAKQIDFPTRNILCVPLRNEESVIGAIEVINKERGGFTNNDKRLLELVAGQLAKAIELVTLRQQKNQEDRLSTLGNIMSTVLHDLRTPVNNIQGFVALLNTPDTSQAERNEFIGIINSQIETVLSMTREILDFVKGKTAILPRKIGARSFFSQLEDELAILIDDQKHTLQIAEAPPIWLYIDPQRMLRAIQNLVKNAVEAMPEGGMIDISLRYLDGENWAILYVRDNGPGIPEAIRNEVFENFSSSGKENGTGLGLAIVRKIIDDHGGEINFSTSDAGTTFNITIPTTVD